MTAITEQPHITDGPGCKVLDIHQASPPSSPLFQTTGIQQNRSTVTRQPQRSRRSRVPTNFYIPGIPTQLHNEQHEQERDESSSLSSVAVSSTAQTDSKTLPQQYILQDAEQPSLQHDTSQHIAVSTTVEQPDTALAKLQQDTALSQQKTKRKRRRRRRIRVIPPSLRPKPGASRKKEESPPVKNGPKFKTPSKTASTAGPKSNSNDNDLTPGGNNTELRTLVSLCLDINDRPSIGGEKVEHVEIASDASTNICINHFVRRSNDNTEEPSPRKKPRLESSNKRQHKSIISTMPRTPAEERPVLDNTDYPFGRAGESDKANRLRSAATALILPMVVKQDCASIVSRRKKATPQWSPPTISTPTLVADWPNQGDSTANVDIVPNEKDGEREPKSKEATKRKRGRPPKSAKDTIREPSAKDNNDAKRKRGRPPKNTAAKETVEAPSATKKTVAKRKRGRPPKASIAGETIREDSAKDKTGGKRKRGRPPKSATIGKPLATHNTAAVGKRKRGRPPKAAIPNETVKEPAAQAKTTSVGKRKRGRPPKTAVPKSTMTEPSAQHDNNTVGKRKRGRPPKNAVSKDTIREPSAQDENTTVGKRKRGRPPKNAIPKDTTREPSAQDENTTVGKRKKGRPPKNAVPKETTREPSAQADNNAVGKRKRGRPPKAAIPEETSGAPSAMGKTAAVGKRKSGQPSRAAISGEKIMELSAKDKIAVATKRGRGRPPKNAVPKDTIRETLAPDDSNTVGKRKRGRPPKAAIPVEVIGEPSAKDKSAAVGKRKRGRPPKHAIPDEIIREPSAKDKTAAVGKRKRGRPPKAGIAEEIVRKLSSKDTNAGDGKRSAGRPVKEKDPVVPTKQTKGKPTREKNTNPGERPMGRPPKVKKATDKDTITEKRGRRPKVKDKDTGLCRKSRRDKDTTDKQQRHGPSCNSAVDGGQVPMRVIADATWSEPEEDLEDGSLSDCGFFDDMSDMEPEEDDVMYWRQKEDERREHLLSVASLSRETLQPSTAAVDDVVKTLAKSLPVGAMEPNGSCSFSTATMTAPQANAKETGVENQVTETSPGSNTAINNVPKGTSLPSDQIPETVSVVSVHHDSIDSRATAEDHGQNPSEETGAQIARRLHLQERRELSNLASDGDSSSSEGSYDDLMDIPPPPIDYIM